MNYLANPLNQYSIYSYNVAIRQLNPTRASTAYSPNQGILIADNSQEARYNIESVELINVLGYGIVRTAFANKFDFIISEPNGVTFLDTIRNAAFSQGINNHLEAIYIVEITFPARGADGRPTKYPTTFRYPVKFIDVSAQVDAGGSRYTISAVDIGTVANHYLSGVVKNTLTFQATTVGQAIAELTKKLNESELTTWETDFNALYFDEYEIEFDSTVETWKDWKFEQADESLNVRNISKFGEDKIEFVVAAGTNLHEFIGVILRCTAEYKKIPTFDNGFARDNGGHEQTTSGSSKLRAFYKVVSKVEYPRFDPVKNDYTKKVTFKIKRHITPELIVDANEYNLTLSSRQEQASFIANLRSEGLLRKRYDYLFTGMNTEVLNLEMKFDLAYYMIAPNHGGQVDHDRLAPNLGNNPSDLRAKIKSVRSQIRSTQTAITNVRSSNIGNPSNLRQEFRLGQDLNRQFSQLESLIGANTLSGIDAPIKIHQGNVDSAYYNSPENDVVESANLQHAAIVANLENSGDMLEIELEIRGDPYWLGKPNSFYNVNLNEEVADYELGGNCFFLNVNLAVHEDGSGRRKPNPEYSITGVYRVINVIHTFRGGLFTQFLKAHRLNTINSSTVADDLKRE